MVKLKRACKNCELDGEVDVHDGRWVCKECGYWNEAAPRRFDMTGKEWEWKK